MSDTLKTVLIVGGTAVGAFILIRSFAPAPTVTAKPKSGTDLVNVNSLIGLGSGLASGLSGLFGGGGSKIGSAPALIDTPSGFMATRDEWQNIADYNAQPGTQFGIAGIDY